jgi:HD superfamily phosphohydrolase
VTAPVAVIRRTQRIRCAVHNLIEFDERDQLEAALWQAMQTPPFQRLRRVRQLGFSELVFPGATHTRFAHSLGVFHTARALIEVIERQTSADRSRSRREHQADVALAAALLHDVGHGMFSHALEAVGKALKLPMAKHEAVSAQLICDSEIADTLKPLAKSFPDEVAELIGRKYPATIYDAVMSSQFDADRLDYMQRDRLMTGVRSSDVDTAWLLANLEVGRVVVAADHDRAGWVPTLVLGPKAARVAEGYLLSLFHLYPNVYLHKTTRGAEMAFQALLRRLFYLHGNGGWARSGLPTKHPIARFVAAPENTARQQALDDGVFWSALPMLVEAKDDVVKRLAAGLGGRRLLKCLDIRARVEAELALGRREKPHAPKRQARVTLVSENVRAALAKESDFEWRVFVDAYARKPYERFEESQTPLNRILIRDAAGDQLRDLADISPVISAAQPFAICRAYVFRDDNVAEQMVENKIRTEIERTNRDGTA